MKKVFSKVLCVLFLLASLTAKAQNVAVGLLANMDADPEVTFKKLHQAGFKACQTGFNGNWTQKDAERLKELQAKYDLKISTLMYCTPNSRWNFTEGPSTIGLVPPLNRVKYLDMHKKAIEVFDMAFNAGWDKEYGGILYFMDCLGNPPEAYEHDMKLWWPHNEALIASMMIYRDTKDEKYLDIFYQILDYCKKVFADEYGEWYGYLRRDGKPTLPACKGSTFKGPFHVPRCLIYVDQLMTQVLEAE